jgi:hypothetical protein
MANLVFELEKRVADNPSTAIPRTIQRMKDVIDEAGILLLNPMGEVYQETRTDLEANIVSPAKVLYVLDVIKPVLYVREQQAKILLQKGVVIVGSKA